MRVLLLELDGKIPNMALLRIAAHHRALGDDIEYRKAGNLQAIEAGLFDAPDRVYASAIFTRSRHLCEQVLKVYGARAVVGGTGWDLSVSLEALGIASERLDYECIADVYPRFTASLGYTQRGCRLSCDFCVVPIKEGKIRDAGHPEAIWRGDGHPLHFIFLDNDFLGGPRWRQYGEWLLERRARVCFVQGINARLLKKDSAALMAALDCYDDSFKDRRIYCAWDNREDEEVLFRGLNLLKDAGVRPDHIMVYMLIGFWPGETEDDRLHRQAKLRVWGARPYPMPYRRTEELVGFQRWVIGAYDKRVPWSAWKAAGYRPENLGEKTQAGQMEMFG